MTKENAKMLHEIFVQDTAYRGFESMFNKVKTYITYDEMYEMLRMGRPLGKAEAYSIITALVMAGAKFEGEMDFIV